MRGRAHASELHGASVDLHRPHRPAPRV